VKGLILEYEEKKLVGMGELTLCVS